MAAATAVRILEGEKPANIKVPPIGPSASKYNWQEMQRWGISESRLPPGSEIYFREPTLWERYRNEMLAILAALLAQTGLIFWLFYEHRRRHLAEVTSRNSMAELTSMNRRAQPGSCQPPSLTRLTNRSQVLQRAPVQRCAGLRPSRPILIKRGPR